ncbi:5'/3'-nucleotidase SurE [Aestuariirhabdus sp. Z084]|uniref:5'/3'-nucleotidase SurE n=1 Tax=Aestuariirhabdus haliotis TaxID=2918751 RepID=UPI00201B4146|nr:5'/3'-nucleotidase SurE [Aestuariirhabdus haliotis]MCL6416359.1 5'/3'-nucleotidase SurE [Aestuariirhabdus haliotis]MCL6420348.1 5'/3'-nucleotidase SurE [Aestuariirhabdus haliotis]
MQILLSNDDGVFAPGLDALYQCVRQSFDCVVVAPDRDRSGASSALTLDRPLRCTRQDNGFTSLNGTPTDCVHLALNGMLDSVPDMVISGINLGANLGDDVLYSGTVAAALEGRFLPRPALAISLCSRSTTHLETAVEVVKRMLATIDQLSMPARSILNVNIPDLPLEELKGVQLTRLGHRARAARPVKVTDPRGNEGYWISVVGKGEDAGEGTDFHAVQAGFVSVTPLQIDKTHYDAFSNVENWLGEVR